MFRPAILAALFLLSIPSLVFAHSFTHGDIQVMHPWAKVAEKGADSSAYVKVINNGAEPDNLIGVESTVAERVEIQKAKKTGNTISYESISSLTVGSKKNIEMKPGGVRLLLVDLKEPLRHEYVIPMTLVFEKSGRMQIQAVIQKSSAEGHSG